MAQRSGFDMSRMSIASKILLGAGILLFIDSFLPWQRVCFGVATFSACASASMWGGNGSIFGVIGALLTIAVVVWEAMAVANVAMNVGMSTSKISAYLGFGALVFTAIKFIFALTNSPAFGAFVGLILALALGYGAWMRFQEPETAMPPPPPGGTTGPIA